MIGKRKLFTETARERIIEVSATFSGVIGGFYGGILYGEIRRGVIYYATLFSLSGAIIGAIFAFAICGFNAPFKARIFLERFISNFISIIGSVLFGMTIGGFYGYFLNHPFFIKLYSKDIYDCIIAIDSNIGDGILIGGISGGIGCSIGSCIDIIFSFFIDIIFRFTKKPKFIRTSSIENLPKKATATPIKPIPPKEVPVA
ncbi:hypothetical protein HZA55_02940 [Candidatus Poribacteria bacterium]|nr:hypothetical protein [Candidatus Poribacteria bacterium]